MTTLHDVVALVASLIASLIPLVVGLAVLLFLWGLATYILKQDNKEARSAARNLMFWGVVTIFVMVSLWGFVNLLDETLGLDNDTPTLPSL